ncbi:MAG: hypothetical protein ACHREM_25350 [Polyangiales bacterium]
MPHALVHGDGSNARLFGVDARAASLGAFVGMTLSQARARIPSLTTTTLDPARLEAVHALIAGALLNVSPRLGVWMDGPLTGLAAMAAVPGFLVDFDDDVALDRLVESVRDLDLGPVTIGVADGAFASVCAARVVSARGDEPKRKVVAHGGDVAFLRALSAKLLPASLEAHDALHALGLRTLGEVAALPLEGVQARLGEEGRRMVLLARGEKVPALATQQLRDEPTTCVDLCDEHGEGAQTLDAILFGLRAACVRLLPPITARGDGVAEIEIALVTAGAPTRLQVRPARPEIDPHTLFELSRAKIEAARLTVRAPTDEELAAGFATDRAIGPVMQLRMTATSCVRVGAVSERLAFARRDATIVRLDVALARLRGRFGTDHVVTPVRREDPRPEARGVFVPANPQRVHESAPPSDARLELELRERLRVPSASIGTVVISRAPEVGDTWPIRSFVAARPSTKPQTIVAIEPDERVTTAWWSAEGDATETQVTYRWIVGSHGARALFGSADSGGAWKLVGIAD